MNHHNLFYWLPPEKYFSEHPEWYAQGADGASQPRAGAALPLYQQPGGPWRELTKNVLQYLRENPETRIVGVIPEDGIGMCRCPVCRRLDADPGDADKPFNSHRQPECRKSRQIPALCPAAERSGAGGRPGIPGRQGRRRRIRGPAMAAARRAIPRKTSSSGWQSTGAAPCTNWRRMPAG